MWLRSTAALLLLASATQAEPYLIGPPPEFDHPFSGRVVLHHQPYRPLLAPLSVARVNHLLDGWRGHAQCDVWLPEASEVGETLRERLWRIEQANCNGWAARDGDVNWR